MSIMEDFEGVKKIKNVKNYSIDFIYSTLRDYSNELGSIELNADGVILIDIEGKYFIKVYLVPDFIKIERELEPNKNEINVNQDIKSIDLSQADRMVEQIYDLLNTIEEDGTVTEKITGVKKVLFVAQEKTIFKNKFTFTSDSGELTYEISENKFSNEFVAVNTISKLEEFAVRCDDSVLGKYSIVKVPYLEINISKKEDMKTLFVGDLNTKELKIRSDYTGNHYLIELDEIVIGAIDLLNNNQSRYRLEINDLSYQYLVAALAIIVDLNYGV